MKKSELNGKKDKGQIECVMKINKKIGMKIFVCLFFSSFIRQLKSNLLIKLGAYECYSISFETIGRHWDA